MDDFVVILINREYTAFSRADTCIFSSRCVCFIIYYYIRCASENTADLLFQGILFLTLSLAFSSLDELKEHCFYPLRAKQYVVTSVLSEVNVFHQH